MLVGLMSWDNHDVLGCEVAAKSGVRGSASDEIDVRVSGHRTRPLNIQDGFDLIPLGCSPGIGTARDTGRNGDSGSFARKAKHAPKIRHILKADIAVRHDRDCFSSSINARIP